MVAGLAVAAVMLGMFLWIIGSLALEGGVTRKQRWAGALFAAMLSLGLSGVLTALWLQVSP